MPAVNRLDPIPHPPKKPFVGNMLALDPNAPIASLTELAKTYGPIFWLDMRGYPVVFVSNYELVDELCDETRFDKTVKGALKRVRPFAGDGLFTADTAQPNWAKAHNILMPPFGNRAMQTYHPMMVDIAQQLCLKWERLNDDEDIDVVHDMTALTLDTIGLCGFDYRFNSFYRRDYHPYVEAMVRSLETAMLVRGLPFEDLLLRNRHKTFAQDVVFMNGMVDQIVAERRKAAQASQKDLLGAMLSGVDRNTGSQLDDVNIRYQINTFLIAGHETTSGLLSYAIYAMLKNPEVMAKAVAETDCVLGANVAASPTYSQVVQLTYITQILKEALRLWPPAPAFSLEPLKDEVIGGQYKLKKGSFINILVPSLHRDPAVWGPRAEIFDPENFTAEAEAKRPANAWKPFGNGQRACIGRGFAMHEAALALGLILQRFTLVDHQRYQLKTKETLTIKPDGFKIKARMREGREHTPVPISTSTAAATHAGATPAHVAQRPSHGTKLLVLYGSNLGTAEELAHRLAENAEVNGFETTLGAMDYYAGKLPQDGALVIFCASYNGAPPDNATKFVEWLDKAAPKDAAKGVNYTVFGCGNREWAATYQSVPRAIDEKLAALGGTRVFDRGEGDARDDLDGQYESWFAKLGPVAAKAFGLEAGFDRETNVEPLYAVETVATAAANPVVAAAGAQEMTVIAVRELQSRDSATPSERSTKHIEIALPAGVTYRVGDHLSVVPRNDPALVAAIARRFGLTSETTVRLSANAGRRAQLPVGEPISVGALLGHYLEVQGVATRKALAVMAAHTRCPMTQPKLKALSADDDAGAALYRAEVLAKRKSIYDLMEEHPACELPFPAYLEALSLLTPRYYSISSSPAGDASKCSITVGVVDGPARSGRGIFRGTCSTYLEGLAPGDAVFASVRETKAGFRLPDDNSVPIIMIGPGTGLAPFRGFCQERAARKAAGATLGPALLFFGCRRPDHDFLYREELEGFAKDGIADLKVAFSRGEGPKTYVQDLVRAEGDAVWRMIEKGAVIYVCGDGGKMEPDVKRALMELHAKKSGGDAAAAQAWIEGMGRDNRYVLDVWSGG